MPPSEMDARYPVIVRDYQPPNGALRHAVSKTGEYPDAGWVIQPDDVPLTDSSKLRNIYIVRCFIKTFFLLLVLYRTYNSRLIGP